MKNCVILEIRERSEQVLFAYIDTRNGEEGEAKLFTEVEAAAELEFLRYSCLGSRFQVVVLRLGEVNEFDRTD